MSEPKSEHAGVHRGLVRVLEAESPAAAREAFAALGGRARWPGEAGARDPRERPGGRRRCARLPEKYRRRLRSTNGLERLIVEVRRRERVIRIFPNERSAWRLLGALLAEEHEEWITGRRYFDMEEYHEWKAARQSAEPERQAA